MRLPSTRRGGHMGIRGHREAGRSLAGAARVVGLGALAVALLAAVAAPARAANKLEIDSLSNRPDKVSGGDILVRVRVPDGTALGEGKVKLNYADVTAMFWQDTTNHSLMCLASGLKDSQNTLNSTAEYANPGALQVVNYPIQGPVFSGPREEPFYCQTHQFRVYPAPGPFFSPAQLTNPCVEQ